MSEGSSKAGERSAAPAAAVTRSGWLWKHPQEGERRGTGQFRAPLAQPGPRVSTAVQALAEGLWPLELF